MKNLWNFCGCAPYKGPRGAKYKNAKNNFHVLIRRCEGLLSSCFENGGAWAKRSRVIVPPYDVQNVIVLKKCFTCPHDALITPVRCGDICWVHPPKMASTFYWPPKYFLKLNFPSFAISHAIFTKFCGNVHLFVLIANLRYFLVVRPLRRARGSKI